MTIIDLKHVTGMNPGTIKRHLSDLQKFGLVFISREKLNEYSIVMKYYRATAKTFVFQISWPKEQGVFLVLVVFISRVYFSKKRNGVGKIHLKKKKKDFTSPNLQENHPFFFLAIFQFRFLLLQPFVQSEKQLLVYLWDYPGQNDQ